MFALLFITMLFIFRPSSNVQQDLLKAEELMIEYPDSCLQVLGEIDNRYLSGENKALYALLMTQAKFKNRQPVNSDSLINIAVDYYKEGSDSLRKAQSYFYKGRIDANINNVSGALSSYQKASIAASLTDNYGLLMLIHNYWGLLLRKQNLYDDALAQLEKSLKYSVLDNDTAGQMFSQREIGKAYFLNKHFKEASSSYKQALRLAYLVNDRVCISNIYNGLCLLYIEDQNYDLSMYYIDKSIAMGIDSFAIYSNFLLKGNLFFKIGMYDSARYYFNKGKIEQNISSKIAYFIYMSELEEKLGNYREALAYSKRYVYYNDSISKNRRTSDIVELQRKYDYSLIENENNRLELDKLYRNTVILTFIIILISVTWIYTYRYKKVRREKDFLLKIGKEELDQVMDKLSKRNIELDQYRQKTRDELEILKKRVLKMNTAIKKIDMLNNMNTNERINKRSIMVLSTEETENLQEVVNTCFDNFAERLVERFPKLTKDNIYFCCLLKMKVPIEIISILLNVTEDSLIKRKYRLKKNQIELSEGYSNLDDFLLDF